MTETIILGVCFMCVGAAGMWIAMRLWSPVRRQQSMKQLMREIEEYLTSPD